MNKLKDHAQKEGLQYFLTYADNNATEFFKKMGFNKDPYMPESRWNGFIKDYYGSTMMQCQIVKDVDYVNISDILIQQNNAIIAKINSVINKRVYPGLKFEDGKEKLSFEEIPGLKEAGWTHKTYEQAKEGEEKTFEQQCLDILRALCEHPNSWPFQKPVDAKKVPDYYNIIKEPMGKILKLLTKYLFQTLKRLRRNSSMGNIAQGRTSVTIF